MTQPVPTNEIKFKKSETIVSPMHRPALPPGNIPGIHFCWRVSQSQGHSDVRRIMSMKISIDSIRNQIRDLLDHSAVPEPTAPQHPPKYFVVVYSQHLYCCECLCHEKKFRN